MVDIFLSYSEEDRDAARRVVALLESDGCSVWWDRRIPAGENWRLELDRAMAEMKCMVVLWSRSSVKSEWVCEEASEGRRLGKLVPVLIEPVRPPAGFREIQAADLTAWDGALAHTPAQELLTDIRSKLARQGRKTSDTPVSEPTPRPAAAVPGRWIWRGAAVAVTAAVAAVVWRSLPQHAGPTTEPGIAHSTSTPAPPPAEKVDAMTPREPTPKPVEVAPANPGSATPQHTKPTATAPVASNKTRPGASSARCVGILQRQQLGEPLSTADLAALQKKEC